MTCDLIMSHIFSSHYTLRALEALGTVRRLSLVDNSYCAELAMWAKQRPFVRYIRPKMNPNTPGTEQFHWSPMTCAGSWNTAMLASETDWIINVNPDTLVWPGSYTKPGTLDLFEKMIEGRPEGVIIIRSDINFNLWAGDRKALLELGGFDTKFKPCGGEDEDMLVRVSKAGKKWWRVSLPASHMDGGHKNRVDSYCNVPYFVEKWGWKPNSKEYNELLSTSLGGAQGGVRCVSS